MCTCVDLYYGGESHGVEKTPLSYTCPLCAQLGFSEAQLRDHVTKQHADSGGGQEVICPVCASHPSGDPNHLTDDFPSHLTMEHRPPPRDYDLVVSCTSCGLLCVCVCVCVCARHVCVCSLCLTCLGYDKEAVSGFRSSDISLPPLTSCLCLPV